MLDLSQNKQATYSSMSSSIMFVSKHNAQCQNVTFTSTFTTTKLVVNAIHN
jgi:hypothetical protein